MKIVHPLLCYYPSQAGGPANTLYWINKALKLNTFSCEVLSTQFGLNEPIQSIEFAPNHKVTFIRIHGFKFVIQSILKVKKADIVQFSSLFFPPTLPILICAVIMAKKIIISPRGELYASARSKSSAKKNLWLRTVKLFEGKINFHATSSFEENIIRNQFTKARSITVIPNFIELPEKIQGPASFNFVFVGRINPIKNIDVLINAFSLLNQHYKRRDIKLFIIGSSRLPYEHAYESELKKQIKELQLEKEIVLKGHLEGDVKNQTIASCRALILPSKSENFGNVVLEALAQGTPVIASTGTPWQELEISKCGYWLDPTPQELMKSMAELLEMGEENYNEMRENAYTLCKKKFDIQSNIQVWENFYKNV